MKQAKNRYLSNFDVRNAIIVWVMQRGRNMLLPYIVVAAIK